MQQKCNLEWISKYLDMWCNIGADIKKLFLTKARH